MMASDESIRGREAETFPDVKVIEEFSTPEDARKAAKVANDIRLATIERCAQIADEPYSDSVQAFGGDEPKAVGMKIAAAIRSMKGAE